MEVNGGNEFARVMERVKKKTPFEAFVEDTLPVLKVIYSQHNE